MSLNFLNQLICLWRTCTYCETLDQIWPWSKRHQYHEIYERRPLRGSSAIWLAVHLLRRGNCTSFLYRWYLSMIIRHPICSQALHVLF